MVYVRRGKEVCGEEGTRTYEAELSYILEVHLAREQTGRREVRSCESWSLIVKTSL